VSKAYERRRLSAGPSDGRTIDFDPRRDEYLVAYNELLATYVRPEPDDGKTLVCVAHEFYGALEVEDFQREFWNFIAAMHPQKASVYR
jgi:hypothetical protein